ncbi:MAG: O-antigen ligase family protein [Candidatus Omnitrophica bacterium]|nr:O-antigen ligase family protein [Candidatus Omnitrophota bacterium]
MNDTAALKRVMRLPISIGLLLFLVVTLIYLAPLPGTAVKTLSPAAFDLRAKYMLDPASWQTLSLYPRATLGALIKLISYIMIFLVIVSKMIRDEKRVSPRHYEAQYDLILLGALIGILSILLHSMCDFNLHIPANALYFTVIMAIAAGLSAARGRNSLNYPFIEKLVNSIILTGFGIAVFGIIQKLGWNGKIYWLITKPGGNFGPYINYDHYAGYMEMCTFLAIAGFMTRISHSSFPHIKRLKDRIVWFSTQEANKTLIYLFFAVVMTSALFLSSSRGGIMSFCAGLAVFYFVCLISAERKKRNRMLLASALVLIFITIMILWVGPEETVDRFRALNRVIRFFVTEKAILSELRPYMWRDTMKLIKDFPGFGTGTGVFSSVFPKYRAFPASFGFLRYAHNDYLQLIAEMGIAGWTVIVVFLGWYFRRFSECLRRLRES